MALVLVMAALFIGAVYWSARRTAALRNFAVKRASVATIGVVVWMGVMYALASRGALHFETPPTMLLALVTSFALAVGLALSPVGKTIATALPLAVLVGYQAFRIGVELILHRAFGEGLIPVQMSFSGRNFDIVTGIAAALVGVWLATGRRSLAIVALWNTLGLALLVNVLSIVLLSSPTPLRVFMNEPTSVLITHAPWVWLPSVLVVAALFGHVVVYRRLAMEWRSTR